MRAWVAPIGLTRRSTKRSHLSRVSRAGSQSIEDDVLRVSRKDTGQPIAGRSLDSSFIHVRGLHRNYATDQNARSAVLEHQPLRLFERHLRSIRALSLES